MKNLKTLAYKVKPTIPESNSLVVVNDKLYYYDENNIEYRMSSSDEIAVSWGDIEDKPTTFPPTIGTTATTAKAGNYQPTWGQVTGKPATFTPSTHTHAWADITDKPALFSGSYDDLTNKPTIPTVGNGTITITQGGVSKGSFTTNQTGNTTVEIDAGGGEGSADLMINTTHADLLSLVNNSELTPGQQYRITDYVATVDDSVYNEDEVGFFARSNNHAFDIIVVADSVNKLNENARAIRHEGDTYFPSHTKFEAWKLKYTIFNDSERFDWTVSSGKGVIYQLIDEWNNDIPYDFKSIQFKRNDVWVYTFGGIADDSLQGNCYSNTINEALMEGMYFLNNNTFGNNCMMNTFGNNCGLNTFGNDCYSNTFGDFCSMNTFGDTCYSNTFGANCNENTFGTNYINYNISSYVSNIDFVSEITNFTTTPSGNVVNVIKTPNGVTFSQVINATTTEAFDV